jgi:hypothetical protein
VPRKRATDAQSPFVWARVDHVVPPEERGTLDPKSDHPCAVVDRLDRIRGDEATAAEHADSYGERVGDLR